MATYKTECDVCSSKFSTTTALLKHRNLKHPKVKVVKSLPFVKEDTVINQACGRYRSSSSYKQWITGVTESINSTLHPKACSKWLRVERHHVPEQYLVNILHHMPSAYLNTVKDVRHLRLPVYWDTTLSLTYRNFDLEEVNAAFGRQEGLQLQTKKSYIGEQVAQPSTPQLTGRDAINAAKAQARGEDDSRLEIPTMEVEIVIGHGEGRATREFDIIWFPNMYSSNSHGKLIFRYFVAKVSHIN